VAYPSDLTKCSPLPPNPIIPIRNGEPSMVAVGGGAEALIFNVCRRIFRSLFALVLKEAPALHTAPNKERPPNDFSQSLRVNV
jgi:hypothetical protein